MALSAPVKAAALVLFIAAIAGATYGVTGVLGNTVESQLLTMSAPHESLNATGGHTVTYVVSVGNRDANARDVVVEIDGFAKGASEPTTVRGNATAAVFVPVDVPDDAAPGQHALTVRLVSEGRVLRERAAMLTLGILPPAPGFAPGDSGEAIYVGRLTATGRVFNTNDPALVGLAIPKTDNYRFSQGLLPIQTAPRPTVVQGFYEGILGMQPGESRTVSFGYDKGYGPATEEEKHPRDDVLVRDLTLENDEQAVPRETFNTFINDTRQGDPAKMEAGDIFRLNQNGNDWPYRITEITAQSVRYKLAAEVGQTYSVYPFWANASVITDINETHVTFRTTPTTEPGQRFTMRAMWPEMSTLKEVNETHIVVRHSPPVGYKYTTLTQMGQPRDASIKEVTEETIVVALPSANPLAGKDLTFDVTLLSLAKRG